MHGHRPPDRRSGRNSAWRQQKVSPVPALGLLACLCGLACGASPGAPDARWPEGALLSADRPALERLLGRLEALQGTPLARAARELRAALPECPGDAELEARSPAGTVGLAEALRCGGSDPQLAGLRAWRGDADLALALPLSAGPRVLLTQREREGHTRIELRWPRSASEDAAAELLPGEQPAGAALLAARDGLLHARVRSDGLDLASLATPGSQADDLFRLRSQLLSSALLDGTWELALYPPAEGEEMPRVAAALGVRVAAAARAAADRFLDDVESVWPLRRRRVDFAGREGACLPDLNLLPELAPCLVATDRALVLGWNADSLGHALALHGDAGADANGEAADPAPGRLEVDFERLRQADLRLAALHDAPGYLEVDFERLRQADLRLAALHAEDAHAEPSVTRWPWRRLVARGRRSGDAVTLEVDLEAARPGRDS